MRMRKSLSARRRKRRELGKNNSFYSCVGPTERVVMEEENCRGTALVHKEEEFFKKESVVLMSSENETVLVIKQSSLGDLAHKLGWLYHNIPSNLPSFISLDQHSQSDHHEQEDDLSDDKCQALVCVPSLPASHLLNTSLSPPPTNVKQLSSSKLLDHSLEYNSLEYKEKEKLRQDSDDELDMPAQDDTYTHPLSPLISSSNYQEPPRKMARLSREDQDEDEEESEEADDGSGTIDQTVPGSEDCAQGNISSPSLSPCHHDREGEEGGGEEGETAIEHWSGSQQVVPSGPEESEEDHRTSLYVRDHQKHRLPQTILLKDKKLNCWREDTAVTWSLPASNLQTCCPRCMRQENNDQCSVTVPLNLSRPRLRLGLSRCQKPHPLHNSLYSREE